MANPKSTEVLEEIMQLSIDVIEACKKEKIPKTIVDQVIRSVTSVGANFAEAQDASSRKDFINKIYIAKKEAFETKYWLTLIYKLTKNTTFNDLSEKSQKFVMMFQKIINTSKEGNRK